MRNLQTMFYIPRIFSPNHTAEKPEEELTFCNHQLFSKFSETGLTFLGCKNVLRASVICFVQLIRHIQTMVKSTFMFTGRSHSLV